MSASEMWNWVPAPKLLSYEWKVCDSGIYHHPNGIINSFVNDRENALAYIHNKTTTTIECNINIDLIKFKNDNTI